MKRFLTALISVAVILSSCGKPDQPHQEGPDPNDTYEATIEFMNGTSVTLSGNDGDCVELRFTCDHEWFLLNTTSEPTDSWLNISKKSGSASAKPVKIVFTAVGDNGYEKRTASFKIASGSVTQKVSLTQTGKVFVLKAEEVQDLDKYYKPQEFNFDMLRSDSKWSWARSKQSEHVVVFWDKQYGEYGLYGEQLGIENTWPTTAKSSKMRVDIDDLLAKAEQFYEVNVNTLKFSEPGSGKASILDDYKFEIYLIYQSEWLATGSGYDNSVGALWVNPSTCQPVGSTIAHEIGHAFQYMVFCDYLKGNNITGSAAISANTLVGPGFRYGFGSNGSGGCGFWEQTAQWQSYQTYKSQAFTDWYSAGFYSSTHLHVLHEAPRYSNYFIHWWWVEQNDIEFIARIWKEAKFPEDPCETYMRLMGFDNAQFNDDMWKYAAHMLTFDCDEIRKEGKNYIGKTAVSSSEISADGDGWRISASLAPESCGSNAVKMNIPTGESREVSVQFEGLYTLTGCHVGPASEAGWRYGFVTLNSDDTRTYGDIHSDANGTATFTVPENAKTMWFVVCGAPKNYERHPWADESNVNDNKWPWKATFTNTKPAGK